MDDQVGYTPRATPSRSIGARESVGKMSVMSDLPRQPIDVEKARYDGAHTASVVGRAGLFHGEEIIVHLGQCIVIGRSRMCDISLARTAECLRLGKEALEGHKSYRKISRKHIRICLLSPDHLEIEDLSTNGTVVNGHRIDRILLTDFASRQGGVVIEFGDGEVVTVKPGGPRLADAAEMPTQMRSRAGGIPSDAASNFDRTPVP